MSGYHRPVMPAEVVAALAPARGGRYIDCTVGGGGHARCLLEAGGAEVRVLGIDRDPEALRAAAQALAPWADRVQLVRGCFSDTVAIAADTGFSGCDGVVADLGVSSHQLDEPGRGFSFSSDAPLDMRMDPEAGESAADLLARCDTGELTRILREYGELPRAGRLARAILRPPLPATTGALAERTRGALPARGRKHAPATLVFQALRIAVNDELGELDRFLDTLPAPLGPGGRVAVIAYHSLEDRRVKHAFQQAAVDCICPPRLPICGCGRSPQLLVPRRRAVRPSEQEVTDNPRSRSARLRWARRPDPAPPPEAP